MFDHYATQRRSDFSRDHDRRASGSAAASPLLSHRFESRNFDDEDREVRFTVPYEAFDLFDIDESAEQDRGA